MCFLWRKYRKLNEEKHSKLLQTESAVIETPAGGRKKPL